MVAALLSVAPFGASLVEDAPQFARSFAHSLRGASAIGIGGCTDGISCGQLSANGLTFDCRFGGPAADASHKGDVLLLHGFPEWSEMYMPTMRQLAESGFRTVACNQRGYSPGASPDGVENYSYDLLADDVVRGTRALLTFASAFTAATRAMRTSAAVWRPSRPSPRAPNG